MNFHHLGIACKNIQQTIDFINKFFTIINISDQLYDEKQDAIVCLVKTKENIDIELISGPMVGNLINKGITYYHTCYTVKNIENTIQELLKNNGVLVSEPKEAILFNNKKIAFLYSPIGLIELLEE